MANTDKGTSSKILFGSISAAFRTERQGLTGALR